MLACRSGGTGWTRRGCREVHPGVDEDSEALNAIVAALDTAAAKADDVQFNSLNDAYADHLVQVMAVSLRKLNRLLGQLAEGQASLPSNRLTATDDRLLPPPPLSTRTCVRSVHNMGP